MSQLFRGAAGGGALGNVTGTPPTTDNAIARYDGVTGLIIQNSDIIIDDDGNLDAQATFTGSTKFFLLQNNDNTAGSSAKISQLVGGTSAGDVYDEFSIGSTRSYAFGVDNNDSQTFKLTTDAAANVDPSSGTTLIDITSAGEISFPSATLTQHGVLVVGASGLLASTAVGTSGDVLTSNGAGLAPTYQPPTTGTVTSVSGTTNRISSTGGATPVIDIDAAYVGQTSLTTLGTVTTGTWNGTAVTVPFGGTGLTTLTDHAVIIGAGTSTPSFVGPVSATGAALVSNGVGSDPGFTSATYPLTSTANEILYSSATNTITGLASGNNGVLITSATGVPSVLAAGTTGQVLTATTGSPPSWAAGGGTVTSVSGTTNRISSTGGATPVIDIDSAYVGQTSLTTLGTVTTGTWNADVVTVPFGGTGLATITDHGIMLGSGTGAVTPTAAPVDGQLLVGAASADPNLITSWMQQGNNCWFWNLSFTHSAGTLTLAGADGTALSTTNPGYVCMQSNATAGRLVLHTITANDTLTVSDMTDNLFGTTNAIAWGSSMPLFVGFTSDSTDANLEPVICRLPHMGVTPASSANMGDPSSANADLESSIFFFNDVTEGDYQSMQLGLIGSLTATKAVTTNAWTLDALTNQDGVGQWNDSRAFTFPVSQNGAGTGKYFAQDANTAPAFSTNSATYFLSRDGRVRYQYAGITVTTSGTGISVLEIIIPLFRNASHANEQNPVKFFDNSASTVRIGIASTRGGNAHRADFFINGLATGEVLQQDVITTDQIYVTFDYVATTTA